MRKINAHFGALRLFAAIAVIAASLRALVPIGYMASLEGGRLAIVPCSGVVGIVSSLNVADGGGGHSHHGDAEPADRDETPRHNQHSDLANCPFAISCCAALAQLQFDLPVSLPTSPAVFRRLSAPTAEPYANPFSARGPPSLF